MKDQSLWVQLELSLEVTAKPRRFAKAAGKRIKHPATNAYQLCFKFELVGLTSTKLSIWKRALIALRGFIGICMGGRVFR